MFELTFSFTIFCSQVWAALYPILFMSMSWPLPYSIHKYELGIIDYIISEQIIIDATHPIMYKQIHAIFGVVKIGDVFKEVRRKWNGMFQKESNKHFRHVFILQTNGKFIKWLVIT